MEDSRLSAFLKKFGLPSSPAGYPQRYDGRFCIAYKSDEQKEKTFQAILDRDPDLEKRLEELGNKSDDEQLEERRKVWGPYMREILIESMRLKEELDLKISFEEIERLEPELAKQWKDFTEHKWREDKYIEKEIVDRFKLTVYNDFTTFTFKGGRPWNFLVFGLPSVEIESFRDPAESALRQHLFAIELIRGMSIVDEFGFKRQLEEQHTIILDKTHMTPRTEALFTQAVDFQCQHIDVNRRPKMNVKPLMISETLRPIHTEDKKRRNMAFIIFKPKNPIRQILQHILEDANDPETYPCIIICAPGDVDNPIDLSGPDKTHRSEPDQNYAGDRNSKSLEGFLSSHYVGIRSIITEEELANLKEYTKYDEKARQEVMQIYGTLWLYHRRDLYYHQSWEDKGEVKLHDKNFYENLYGNFT